MTIRRSLALAIVVLSVAACTSGAVADKTADGSGGELQTTTWVLSSYAVEGALVVVPDGLYADADFKAQRVTGFAGCNDYDAVYRTGGRMLLVSMPRTTLMSCGEAADAFQSAYLALLQQSRFYNVRAATLTIRGAAGATLLVFDAAPNNPLLGSWVVDSFATAPGTVTAPLAGSELTVVFRLVRVAGSSGCNTFQGPYTTNGTVAAIGPLASTQKACAEDVMAQETAFLAALQGVARVEPRGDTLRLQDRGGSIIVSLVKPSTVEPSPGPSASAKPSASAPPTAAPSPTAKPTATVAPTATPTALPTQRPTPPASGSPAPTVVPPASLPPVATCALNVVVAGASTQIATIVYPADWFTVAAPPTAACRYFDPAPITVPADPATLATAVMVKADLATTYEAALAAATNPTAWNVLTQEPVTVAGLPATRIEATSTVGSPGYPVGVTRYAYLIDAGGRPVWFETSGTVGDATYATNKSVVDLMVSQSTITAVAIPA